MRTMAGRNSRALRALFASIVDYAGLFPPAGLGMADAVGRFVRYRRSDEAWMLGRFVAPVSRLSELTETLSDLPVDEEPLALSVVLSGAAEEQLATLGDAGRRLAGRANIVSLEVPPVGDARIVSIAKRAPGGVGLYFELAVPPADAPARDRAALAKSVTVTRDAGGRAKIRTGGVTAAAIPSIDQVSRFIAVCVAVGVSFKATAGLHRPLRGPRPLTYEPGSDCAVTHGFLNLAVAAVLQTKGAEPAAVVSALEQGSAVGLRLDDDALYWGGLRISRSELGRARESGFHSFGSCSFEEPVDGLVELGLS